MDFGKHMINIIMALSVAYLYCSFSYAVSLHTNGLKFSEISQPKKLLFIASLPALLIRKALAGIVGNEAAINIMMVIAFCVTLWVAVANFVRIAVG
ncbi:hypothetical protein [Photobacterium lutimaris]|uniref:hypothetical protein n=1 Tax=Photobacterium lutimaris TaxID=388278 RepID=UPI0011B1D62F|nr:hypothetical protein [Photobacterium lutimaris]